MSNKPFFIFLPLAVAYLALQMPQGLSHLDIGMYMSGCQHFCQDPLTVCYLGQWLLTYLVQGSLCQALGVESLMGLRLMHLILTTAMLIAVYLFMKRQRLNTVHIVIGLALATLAHIDNYSEANYNDWSVMALTMAVMAFYEGIAQGLRRRWIVLSGLCVGIGIFFRAVNLTFLILPLMAITVGKMQNNGIKARAQLVWFALGVALGGSFVVVLAMCCGMGEVLMLTVSHLFSIGTGGDDPHGMKQVALSAYTYYKGIIQGFAPVAVLGLLMWVAKGWLKGGIKTAALTLLVVLIVVNIYLWEPSCNITAGLSLTAFALSVWLFRGDRCFIMLFALALAIPVIYPLGSNAGAAFFSQHVAFMTLPLAITALAHGTGRLAGKGTALQPPLSLFICAIALGFVLCNIKRPLMEDGNRLQCQYTVNSNITAGIATTRDNAETINYLLKEVKPRIKKNDYMICTFAPTMVPILECRPYAVFSTVFTSGAMNQKYIDIAYNHTGGRLPLLLAERSTMTEKDTQLELMLKEKGAYKTVWTDGRYCLMAPK